MSMQSEGVSRRDFFAAAATAAAVVAPLAANAEVEYPNVPFRESRLPHPPPNVDTLANPVQTGLEHPRGASGPHLTKHGADK